MHDQHRPPGERNVLEGRQHESARLLGLKRVVGPGPESFT